MNRYDTPILIYAEGGIIQNITTNDGKSEVGYVVIDFDSLEDGECPVCRNPVEFPPINNSISYQISLGYALPCETCGYSEELDNAEECAVKYHHHE
jgi:hypothetical protein